MAHKFVIRPDRLRRVPAQFSWIDHRLVRERYIQRCNSQAWTLYLFLVTVGDDQGLSYYSDRSIQNLLSIDQTALEQARDSLIRAEMVAFDAPLYQVLSLDKYVDRETLQINTGPQSIGAILRQIQLQD
ncbi:MAG: hypothetical protein HQL80_05205 [Magnetococcales bacterium]|nr:hypothetical protein [Magnetococcales bacterium]